MNKPKKIASLFFVALFMSYYASLHLFSHVHTIRGATVVHSHIHTDSHHQTKNGGHTEQSITLIAQVTHSDYLDFSCNLLPSPFQVPLHQDRTIETTPWVFFSHLQNLSLRAPPIK